MSGLAVLITSVSILNKIIKLVLSFSGVEEVVRGFEGTHLADSCIQKNSSNAIYSYQVRCMHVHVMAPGQRLYG
jgi:hypothetical protein